jgi:hypothetical protein
MLSAFAEGKIYDVLIGKQGKSAHKTVKKDPCYPSRTEL